MSKAAAGAGSAPLSTPAVLAFAAANIPIAAVVLAVTVHLPKYFATNVGLSLTAVGAAFGLVKLVDIPFDVLLGVAMDRTRTRFGRYRIWVLAGAPVMMLGLFMLMRASSGVGQTWLVGWLLVMYVGMSMMYLAHLAWAANISPTYDQRSRTMSAITALGVVGAVSALLIPVVMDGMGRGEAAGVQAMVWFIIAAAPVTALIATAAAGERTPRTEERFALGDYLGLLKNGNVLRLLVADLLFNLGPGWMAALYLFYFTDHRGFTTGQANLLLLAYLAAGAIGAPLTAWLANRLGKHRALMINTTVYSLSLLAPPLYPPGAFWLALPAMISAGAMYTGFLVSIRALTCDIADERRLANGREWMGLMYAMVNITSKGAGALAIILTFSVLEHLVGYDATAGAANTPAALAGLQVAFLAGPIVFVMLGGACFIGYKLDARRHGEIRAELDARDALALAASEGGQAAAPRPAA